jgi:CLIP-associating protein 1/2
MLALVQIRRANHLFPIRPYLPALVDALEDSDASVRECAKTSVVELFTGPGVTDAARADLKKALAQKGTRRPIADAVLAQVAARGSAPATPALGSDDGGAASGKKEYIPPSMMLMGKKPSSDAPAGPGTMGRTVSTTVPRAPSRSVSTTTQIAASMPPTPTETSGDDIKVVYVRRHSI